MADPILYGADGRPLRKASASASPLAEYAALEPVRDRGSYVEIDKAALDEVARERARKLAITSVPSTKRTMIRDAGGVAVAKGAGRWPHITTETLRDLRERAPILQPIHQARQYQIRQMAVRWPGKKGTVGIRVVHKDHHEHNATPPAGFKRYIEQFERVLWKPAPSYGVRTLGSALTELMEDLLTINRPTVEVIPSAVDPNRIVQWRPVDGALIWPTLLWVERWKAENPRWSGGYDTGRITESNALDLISAIIDQDLHGAEHVLVRDGIAEAVYTPGRLLVEPIRNRTDVRYAGYPPSHVEQAIALVAAFIHAFDYNATYFTKGMMSEFILGLPADMHDDDIKAFVDMFRESTQGTGRAWQPPMIPLPHGKDTIQKIDLKQSNREMMYEVFLSLTMSLAAAIYRMDMSSVNAKPWDGGSSPTLSEGNRTQEIALAKEEGLQGDLGHLIDHILNPLAWRCHPDLRVMAEYGNYDAEKEARVYEIRGRTDMTRNEIRLEQGAEPMGFWMKPEAYKTASDEDKTKFDDNPWNWPTDPTFATAKAAEKTRQQQEQMMAQQGQQGPPVDPNDPHSDGFGGHDDGFGGAHPAQAPAPYGTPPAGGPAQPPQGMAKAVRTVHVHVHDDPRYE